jgi:hypothetical protein
VAVFTVDTVRRAATEAIIPYVLNNYTESALNFLEDKTGVDLDGNGDVGKKAGKAKKTDGKDTHRGDDVAEECSLDTYEQFDDFLEMVIQLGYICMFAAAFPLAAPLSLAAIFVEIRTDAFKLAFNTRRPHAARARNIGPWENIMAVIILLSCLTNVVIAGLSSKQLRLLFPSFFVRDACCGRSMAAVADDCTATTWSVTLMVGIEHLLLLAGILALLMSRPLPAGVRDEMARREHDKKQALLQQRLRMRKEERLALRQKKQAERQERRRHEKQGDGKGQSILGSAVNFLERSTGVDLDGNGDVGN